MTARVLGRRSFSGRFCRTVPLTLTLFLGLALAGCASSTLEQDQALMEERMTQAQAELLRAMNAPVAAWLPGSTPGGATGRSLDRWAELRDRADWNPRELKVEVERMVAEADRERMGAEARSILLPRAELMQWREANQQLRQARVRLQSQLSTLETAPSDQHEELKREIEATWQQVRQRLDAVITAAP